MDAPSRVAHYRILRQIGKGAMGVVYAAEDERLGRLVALKVLPEDSADPDARLRLEREARIAAGLSHPLICQVFELGEWNHQPFLAMELLAGEPLTARLSGTPLPPGEALSIALSVVEALAAARQEEGRFAGFPMLRAVSTGLRATLEGRHAEAAEALRLFDTFGFTDGEGLFYAAEIYARLEDVDHALVLLARAVDAGFVCLPAFERDAFLIPLRETRHWDSLLERVRSEQRPVVDEFLERGGPTLLGRSP